MSDSLLQKAEEAREQKDFSLAETIYRTLLQENSQNMMAFQAWAEMALDLSNAQAAFGLAQNFLTHNPDHNAALCIMGRALVASDQFEQAAHCYNHALSINPQDIEARYQLGKLCVQTQNWKAAVECLSAIDVDFKDTSSVLASALKQWCLTLHKEKDADQTKVILARALDMSANDSDLWFVQGQVQMMDEDLVSAITTFKQIIEQDVGHMLAQYQLGYCLDKLGWTHEAIGHVKTAYDAHPENDRYLLTLVECHERLGQYEQALALIERLDKQKPEGQIYALAEYKIRLLHWLNKTEEMNDVLDQLAASQPLRAINLEKMDPERRHNEETLKAYAQAVSVEAREDRSRAFTYLAIGQFHHRNKSFDAAMDCYHAGHALVCPKVPVRLSEDIVAFRKIFTPEAVARLRDFGNSSTCPIFIVGMPRSGTSLLEAMLARHDKVAAAGELSFMMHAPKFIPGYPETLDGLDATLAQKLSQGYLSRLVPHQGEKAHVVDKMPINFQQVGLMATLFPNARFLHTIRNPIANCFSIYQQMFSGHHPYSHDLEHIAFYYKDHLELMDFWASLFGDRIQSMMYEDLVQDPRHHAQEILDFLNLDWQEAILQQREDTVVRTASSWQVKQKIYTSAIEGWRRYEAHLGILKDMFGESS